MVNYMNNFETILWLILTVYYEARGESSDGQKAVVKVILNRSKRSGKSVKDVVLARKQFSCYNDGLSSPLLYIKNLPVFLSIHQLVQEAMQEWLNGDILKGATHYYAIKGMVNNEPPYWASSMKFITEIGGHRFFREG